MNRKRSLEEMANNLRQAFDIEFLYKMGLIEKCNKKKPKNKSNKINLDKLDHWEYDSNER